MSDAGEGGEWLGHTLVRKLRETDAGTQLTPPFSVHIFIFIFVVKCLTSLNFSHLHTLFLGLIPLPLPLETFSTGLPPTFVSYFVRL